MTAQAQNLQNFFSKVIKSGSRKTPVHNLIKVDQLLSSKYVSGQEICGGVPDQDSIDLMAKAFIRLNRRALGCLNNMIGKNTIILKYQENSSINFIMWKHSKKCSPFIRGLL